MSNKSPFLWISLFLLLFAVQVWLVPAVVHTVTDSEWLRGTAEQGGNASPISNESTAAAYAHCNRALSIRSPEVHLQFPDLPERSWDLGFGRFMIAGLATASNEDSTTVTHRYLCRIQHLGGELAEYQNWKVDALELIND